MNLEDQVCDLQYAKRLKELDVKQDSLMYWWDGEDINDEGYCVSRIELEFNDSAPNNFAVYSAFTVAELGEMLPINIKNYELEVITTPGINNDKHKKYWRIRYISLWDCSNEKLCEHHDFNEANARAKLLIYLLEKNIIKAEDFNV